MRLLIEIGAVIAGAYAHFLVFAHLAADRIVFRARCSSYRDGSRVSRICGDDGTRLTAVHLPAEKPRASVLYLHGNAEDLGDILPRLEALQRHGYSVLAFDYRGYGTSPGMASEATVVADAAAALRHLCTLDDVSPREVILYGRSLGGGPGVVLAARTRVGGLVLDGAFTSAFRVVTRVPVVPFDRFRNLTRLPAVSCPVLVIHGTQDETVPFTHGERLFRAAPAGSAHLWVEGAGHNNVVEVAGDAYWQALASLAARIAPDG